VVLLHLPHPRQGQAQPCRKEEENWEKWVLAKTPGITTGSGFWGHLSSHLAAEPWPVCGSEEKLLWKMHVSQETKTQWGRKTGSGRV
jgi:hypothetical protein